MSMNFGLGSDTMLSQYQVDTSQFKLNEMASTIQRFNSAPVTPGQAPLSAATYVDYTFAYLNRFMDQDSINDKNTVFLFEYQALLRSRMQQLITDLTAALTRDLDKAMTQTREVWNTEATLGPRGSAQGYTSDVEDAGAARMAYNFFTGFASNAGTSDGLAGAPYVGIPTFDTRTGDAIGKVSPDTQSDAAFSTIDPFTNIEGVTTRVFGTAVIQQSSPEDQLDQAVIDNLLVIHQDNTTRYRETGGGFIAHENRYKFIDIEGGNGNPDDSPTNAAYDAHFDAQNIRYLNPSLLDGATEGGNLNNQNWDQRLNGPDDKNYYNFNRMGEAKNEFQRVLFDTIMELDQRNMLRDIFRLSEKNGFLTDVQVASTSSLTTGTQIQASLLLNYVPRATGPITASTANTITVTGGADVFTAGDLVYIQAFNGQPAPTPPAADTRGYEQRTVTITGISGNVITFAPPTPAASAPFSTVEPRSAAATTRPDLGGRIQVVMDRFSAFFHS